MYIHADMPGSGTLLLALDGVPVGLVVEADTGAGWLRRYDTREANLRLPRTDAELSEADAVKSKQDMLDRLVRCPIVREEGKVDFVGDTATDPDWMISQRMAAIRIRHGLPIDVSVTHDTGGMVASVLERLAAQLRCGSMTAVNFSQSRASDKLPLPDDRYQYLPTGRMSLSVEYESPDAVGAYETARTEWARQHPELVAEHVRSLTEGKARIVEETEATAALRARSAEARAALRRP